MDSKTVAAILADFRDGRLSMEQALDKFKDLPYEDLDFVKIDHHRMLRQGFPEVVFAQGKTPAQVAAIVERLAQVNGNVIASRATPEMYEATRALVPAARYHEVARMIVVRRDEVVVDEDRFILVMTAGTSDIPVAEEAALTAEIMGNKVTRVFDVGVAGIHRLLAQRQTIEEANVIIVVAGMEGALASVVGGMVAKPVIAVPTSVGYGANFGGIAALLAMLNSCAAGVAVVNIDNGFGAGRLASIINKMR
ncbi:nickel pincer cofactor biosynthesis protein LarB [Anaeroselena agilis]|uniref:Nickel pincer cofactor biosynthesis protein LarB n=1 Tax=Anaeroselena agilis TaxID=3063788 RepID=A0ABU3NZB4_9FIRM|nr:nickel pincer cofactor biosynthesis protein LarB [Selenomonadales bacterium 4137-cl]